MNPIRFRILRLGFLIRETGMVNGANSTTEILEDLQRVTIN